MKELTLGQRIMGVVMVCAGGVFVFVVLAGAGALINGWVLTKLWAWFVVPMGGPAIGLVQAMGLGLLAHWLTNHSTPSGDQGWTPVLWMLGKPLVTLGMGALIRLLM